MTNFDQESLREEYHSSVFKVGEALGSSGSILTRYTELFVADDESLYGPMPTLKIVDGTVEARIHPESVNFWSDITDEVEGLNDRDARALMFASTASLVELSFLSLTAKQERRFEGIDGMNAKAIGRAASIASRFFDKDEVIMFAEELESSQGLSGLRTLAEYLRPEDILDINRIRYAVGNAYFSLEVSETVRNDITNAFRKRLMIEMGKYNELLLEILEAFSSSEQKYARFLGSIDKLKSRSMAQFLVAGSSPMGY